MIIEQLPALHIENDESFFEVFARIVKESGLTQYRIVQTVNERSRESAIFMLDKPLHQATLSRIVRGIATPSNLTLYRIARLGLCLSEADCTRLERLRQTEPFVNQATQPQVVIVQPQKTEELSAISVREKKVEKGPLPAWILEKV